MGIFAAVLLYSAFWSGNEWIKQFFPSSIANIRKIYDFRQGAADFRIAILMILIIGPGEELFWRAYLQRRLSKQIGRFQAFVFVVFLYAGVHAASGNPYLVLAAFAGGLFWGWIYFRLESIIVNSASHILWDIAVFLLFPFH